MAYASAILASPANRKTSLVAIRRAADYSADLANLLFETLLEFNPAVRDKTVLLKPNLVGHDPRGITNTHPALIMAARECFHRLGAREVVIAEGPATDRDTESILESTGLRGYLGRTNGEFVDLNVDDVHAVALRTRASRLKQISLPSTVLRADFIVSLPKMKTHHWAGVTLSLKNLFGIVPGCCYGWPKNILHWAGISRVILDLASTVSPDFSIVDGIVGMEGDGPLEGFPKTSGVIVMGDDAVAVDATCARVMGLRPERIDYLERAGLLLGNLKEDKILQLGESVAECRAPYKVVPAFHALKSDISPAGRVE
ncbi:MAG: DUF362 domain-containing protein [Candidatus Acidiferrales bacterium]